MSSRRVKGNDRDNQSQEDKEDEEEVKEEEEEDRKMPAVERSLSRSSGNDQLSSLTQEHVDGVNGNNLHHDNAEDDVDNEEKEEENDDDEDDDDDDDDDWSRRVETDEVSTHQNQLLAENESTTALYGSNPLILPVTTTSGGVTARTMESVAELDEWVEDAGALGGAETNNIHSSLNNNNNNNNNMNHNGNNSNNNNAPPPPPTQPTLSLKEEAILRERQRRIETERARLKRQFALSNQQQQQQDQQQQQQDHQQDQQQLSGRARDSTHAIINKEGRPDRDNLDDDRTDGREDHSSYPLHSTTVDLPHHALDSASIAETIESTMVHPDEENAENPEMRLGFNMERFLRNSDVFSPAAAAAEGPSSESVVMERFLKEPIVVSSHEEETTGTTSHVSERASVPIVQRAVSFEAIPLPTDATTRTPNAPATFSSFEEDNTANISIQVHPDDEAVADDDVGASTIPEGQERRGLTEAELQALVATEEASIANAPPSERDELLSEVGELADHFETRPSAMGFDFSQGTPTTAMESASLVSGGKAASLAVSSDHQSETTTEPAVVVPVAVASSSQVQEMRLTGRVGTPPMSNQSYLMDALGQDSGSLPTLLPSSNEMNGNHILSSDLADAATAPGSPQITLSNQAYMPWSPPGKMNVSPLNTPRQSLPMTRNDPSSNQNYPVLPLSHDQGGTGATEVTPLLDVPPEIITTTTTPHSTTSTNRSSFGLPTTSTTTRQVSPLPLGSSLWNDLQGTYSNLRKSFLEESSGAYVAMNPVQRVIGRSLSLVLTLILVVPTVWMIRAVLLDASSQTGDDDYDFMERFVVYVALLPLSLVLQSQVQNQSSQSTKNSIAFRHVSLESWLFWYWTEILTANLLGIALAVVLAALSLIVSRGDGRVAMCVGLGQLLSGLVISMVGPIIPFVEAYTKRQHLQQEGGGVGLGISGHALSTAWQNLVGTLIWMLLARVLLLKSTTA